jgi:16S rRNA (cytosine1402-N4)-methyltransferase
MRERESGRPVLECALGQPALASERGRHQVGETEPGRHQKMKTEPGHQQELETEPGRHLAMEMEPGRHAVIEEPGLGGAMAAEADAGRHQTVLLEPVLAWLRPRGHVGFRALDCTVNGGGHSFGLLERSAPDGRLVGLDADAGALALAAARLAPYGARVRLVHANFRTLDQLELEPLDAIVFDLGLSSVQLEASGRGFSLLRGDEPLDMRFDAHSAGPTAAALLNTLPEVELERIFRDYGEERAARRLARLVVQRRVAHPFERTQQLVDTVTRALGPQRGRIHPATRAFQALRIATNDELGALEAGLEAAVQLLRPGGRLAVISFHSLEDRIVKWRFRGWAEAGQVLVLTRKPQQPDDDEVRANPRARSAKLRVVERLAA